MLLIINEIIGDALVFHLEDTYVLLSPVEIHVEIGDIFHLAGIFLGDLSVFRDYHPTVVIFLVQTFWKRTDDVRKTSGFDKRDTLRCCK